MTATTLLALVALTQSPDAPVAVVGDTQLLDVRSIEMGEQAPFAGCVMDDQACLATARRIHACEGERAALRNAAPSLPWWGVPIAAVAGLVAGFGLYAALHPPPGAASAGPP